MKKSLAALLATLMMLTGLVVAATPVAAACGVTQVTVYKDHNLQPTSSAHTFCGSVFNLGTANTGPCNPPSLNWNDCISSIRIDALSATMCLGIYKNAAYDETLTVFWGPQSFQGWNLNGSWEDTMSSLKFYSKVPATPSGNCYP